MNGLSSLQSLYVSIWFPMVGMCCVTNAMRRRHFKSYTHMGGCYLMMFIA